MSHRHLSDILHTPVIWNLLVALVFFILAFIQKRAGKKNGFRAALALGVCMVITAVFNFLR